MLLFGRQDCILSDLVARNFSILRRWVRELSHFKIDAYLVILTAASDLKVYVGGVYLKERRFWLAPKPADETVPLMWDQII